MPSLFLLLSHTARGTLVLGHAMKGMLVGVTPTDWRLYVGMTVLLALVALLAALVPTRRATAIDPMTALRCD